MKPGEPNNKTVIHNQWWRDMYPNLYSNDCLWANMIRRAEWLQWVDQTHINDPVLLSLFWMGVLDWTSPNKNMHQVTQAIQHSTAMHFHTFPCIMKLEHRVRKTDIGLFDSPNPFLF